VDKLGIVGIRMWWYYCGISDKHFGGLGYICKNGKNGNKNKASTAGTNDKYIGAEVHKRETTRCE